MGDKKRSLQLLQSAAENAVDNGMAGVMVIATDGNETISFPEVASDVDPRIVSLWMLGAHLEHMEESANAAGGDLTKQQAARDAIAILDEMKAAGDMDSR